MLRPTDIRADLELTNAEFLLTELEVALTFLAVADTTHDPEAVQRNGQHARLAYDTVIKFLPRVKLAEADRTEIERRLELLKDTLAKRAVA